MLNIVYLFFCCFNTELFLSYDVRYVWESKADGSFAVSEDTENEPLGRGTEIRLHLRDEAKEYLEEGKLKVTCSSYFVFSKQSVIVYHKWSLILLLFSMTSTDFLFCSFWQDLVKRYSEFINFPIYLWASKEVDVEVPADEDESSDEEESCMYQ